MDDISQDYQIEHASKSDESLLDRSTVGRDNLQTPPINHTANNLYSRVEQTPAPPPVTSNRPISPTLQTQTYTASVPAEPPARPNVIPNTSQVLPQQDITPPKPQVLQSQGVLDAFQHVLMFLGLYAMTTSMTMILRYFVSLWLVPPKAANASSALSYVSSYVDSLQTILLRSDIAAFLIGAPLFAWMFIVIARKDKANAQRTHSSWRMSVVGLAILPAIIALLFDLGFLAYHLLSWDFTVLLTVNTVVGMLFNGIIAVYYIWALYRGATHES